MNPLHRKPPKIVAIELTSLCNFSCRQCPQSTCSIDRGFMDEETFLAAISRCEGYTELNWRGEPLLHPRLVDFVRIAKRHNDTLSLGFHTNASLMTESLFNQLASAGLDWIHVSLHDATACDTFKKIRTWNETAGNPLYVYAEVDSSEEELVALSCGISREEYQKYHIANWAGYLTGYKIVHDDPRDALKDCEYVIRDMVIVAWDGTVNACCWDFEQRHVVGHVMDFDSVHHSPPYELCRYCIWKHERLDHQTYNCSIMMGHAIVSLGNKHIAFSLNDDVKLFIVESDLSALLKKIKIKSISSIKDGYLRQTMSNR